MSCDVGEVTERLENEQSLRHSSFSNTSVALPTSQLILQPSVASPTSQLILNPSFASATSQALHLRHLASRPWIEGSKIRRYSHVKRMNIERMPRQALEYQLGGKKPRGWPRYRWEGRVKKNVEKRGINCLKTMEGETE